MFFAISSSSIKSTPLTEYDPCPDVVILCPSEREEPSKDLSESESSIH